MDLIFNKGVTMVVTMVAVFMLSLIVSQVLKRAFEKYQERYVVKSMRDLSEMFLFIDGRQLLILNICIAILF